MSEDEIVDRIAEIFVDFCMPRECYSDALIYAREVYDVVVRGQLEQAWDAGRQSREGEENPYS